MFMGSNPQCFRIRKVKCDESRPHCLRCSKGGWDCDGYGPRKPSSADVRLSALELSSSSLLRPLVTKPTSLTYSSRLLDYPEPLDELRSLDFFKTLTAPRIARWDWLRTYGTPIFTQFFLKRLQYGTRWLR